MPKPVQASTYNFRDIIENGFLYVDKTRHLYELVRYGKGLYFLARPRRFGKSLLLSTLEELFRGNKELFQGLWIYDSDYKWQAHPIIHIDFSRYQIRSVAELHSRLQLYFQQIAQQYQITLDDQPIDVQWVDLIMKLSREQRVVILIDEYDKPILDNIHNLEEAKVIRDTLKSFYIDYDLQLDYEKYYQTIFYLIFLLIRVRIEAEVKTNQGRIDAVIVLRNHIYLFEFKLDKSAAEALQQLKENEYYQKYRQRKQPLTLIGANFDTTKRQVSEWRQAAG